MGVNMRAIVKFPVMVRTVQTTQGPSSNARPGRLTRSSAATNLGTSYLAHRFLGHRHRAKAVVTDCSIWQRLAHALGKRRAHVHAHVLDLRDVAAVYLQVGCEVGHSAVVVSGGRVHELSAIPS